jgi:hypothetical protein
LKIKKINQENPENQFNLGIKGNLNPLTGTLSVIEVGYPTLLAVAEPNSG